MRRRTSVREVLRSLIVVLGLCSLAFGNELDTFDQALARGDLTSARQVTSTLPAGNSRALAEAELARQGLRPGLAWSLLATVKVAEIPPSLASRFFRLRGQLGSASRPDLARRDLKESLSRARSTEEKALALQATIAFLVEWEQPAEAQMQLRALLLLQGEVRRARESAAILALGDGQAEQAVLGLEALAKEAEERSTPLLAIRYRLEEANAWRQLENSERSQLIRRQCAEQALRMGQPQLAALALKAMLPSGQTGERLLAEDRAIFTNLLQKLPRSAERTLLLADLGAIAPRTPSLLEQAYQESLSLDPLVQAYARFYRGVGFATVDRSRALVELEAARDLLSPYQDAWLEDDRWSVDRISVLNELSKAYRGEGMAQQARANRARALEVSAQHALIAERQALLGQQLVAAISALDDPRCRSVWQEILSDFDRAKPSEIVTLLPAASTAFSTAFNALEDELIGYNHWSPEGPLERELSDTLRGRPGLIAGYLASCDGVLARARRINDVDKVSDVLYHRAQTLVFLGQYTEAERDLEKCESTTVATSAGQARLLILRGQILARTGRLTESLGELGRRTEQIAEEPIEKRYLRALLAKEALRAGRPAEAIPFIDRALTLAPSVPLQMLKANALVALDRRAEAIELLRSQRQFHYRRVDRLLSRLLAQSGQVDEALAINSELLRGAANASSPLSTAGDLVDRAEIEGYAGSSATRASLYQQALEEFISARSRLDPLLARELFETSAVGRRILQGLPREARAALLAQPSEPSAPRPDERAAFLSALQSLRLQEPGQTELGELMKCDFVALQRTLDKDTVLLHPVVMEHGLAWVYLTNQGSELKLLAITRQDLEGRVEKLLQAASTPATDVDYLRRLSKTLSLSILEPIAEVMQGKKTLVIVPTGPLARLPFELLMDNRERYLIESYDVSYRTSLGPGGPPAKPLDAGRLLVYDDKSGLAGARAEAAAIQRLLSPEVLDSHTWSPQAFRSSALTSSLIHIAAHGLSQEGDAVSQISLGDIGLKREDVEGLQMAPGSLVVLSACSGARANVGYGTRKESMVTAFLDAGASAAVGAYWEVDDRSSSDFFQSFYAGLTRGESIASALTRIKRDWISSPKLSHPFFWAPYVVYEKALPL